MLRSAAPLPRPRTLLLAAFTSLWLLGCSTGKLAVVYCEDDQRRLDHCDCAGAARPVIRGAGLLTVRDYHFKPNGTFTDTSRVVGRDLQYVLLGRWFELAASTRRTGAITSASAWLHCDGFTIAGRALIRAAKTYHRRDHRGRSTREHSLLTRFPESAEILAATTSPVPTPICRLHLVLRGPRGQTVVHAAEDMYTLARTVPAPEKFRARGGSAWDVDILIEGAMPLTPGEWAPQFDPPAPPAERTACPSPADPAR